MIPRYTSPPPPPQQFGDIFDTFRAAAAAVFGVRICNVPICCDRDDKDRREIIIITIKTSV